MNVKKGVSFLNPVSRSPWESQAPKSYLSAKRNELEKNRKTCENLSTVRKAEYTLSRTEVLGNVPQKHTTTNTIQSGLIYVPQNYVALEDTQSLNPESGNVDSQCDNVQTLNVTHQNIADSNYSVPSNFTSFYKETSVHREEEDKKLYAPGNSNFHYATMNSNTNLMISSSLAFPKTSTNTVATSQEYSQNYVNQQWISQENAAANRPTLLTTSNTIIGNENIQSNQFTFVEKESEEIVNQGTISAVLPSTFFNEGFEHNNYNIQANNILEQRLTSCAFSQHFPQEHLLPEKVQSANILSATTSLQEQFLTMGSQNRTDNIASLDEQVQVCKRQHLRHEEQTNSTVALEFFQELRNVQLNIETDRHARNVIHESTNNIQKIRVVEENPANSDYFKDLCKSSVKENEVISAGNLIASYTTPSVNINNIDDDFLNCSYGAFDVNETGDLEFPNEQTGTYNISQTQLGTL